eukprot:CAMPEP_0194132472 /NCGR_PEP_ID=MMETSP0152-20130528/2935_1 /TAXON_ID=1049557 /ORGANISM="Thalassiothrix antarctica, Strain L6-D1" /LENGTH=219 /DNA_ID=CAMNT_0038827537 /DNA_START=29 /DNA_END=688 /DNA_ORIENTATION=+
MIDENIAAEVAATSVVSNFESEVRRQQRSFALSSTRNNKKGSNKKGQRQNVIHSKTAGDLFLCSNDKKEVKIQSLASDPSSSFSLSSQSSVSSVLSSSTSSSSYSSFSSSSVPTSIESCPHSINWLRQKKLNQMKQHPISQERQRRYEMGTKKIILSEKNNPILDERRAKMARKSMRKSRSRQSLFKQLRKSGMEEEQAWRRQENYLKLVRTVGYFDLD